MTKIAPHFVIPNKTLDLERHRSPATMSEDDLRWCFGGQLSFTDAESGRTLLSLHEASLIGLAEDLSNTAVELTERGKSSVRDREGAYSLVFLAERNRANVRDEFTGQSFDVELSDLIGAMRDYSELLESQLRQLFPELATNSAFENICQGIHARFRAIQEAD